MKYIFLLLACLVPMTGLAIQQSPEEVSASGPAAILAPEEDEKVEAEPDDRIEQEPDCMPQFQGGDLATFQRWVMMRVHYPTEAVENGICGRVLVEFVVERDGSITIVEVPRSPAQVLTDEVLRVLSEAPLWTPGQKDGQPVRVQFSLPIVFQMQ